MTDSSSAPAPGTTERPAEVPLTATDHINKGILESFKKKLDREQPKASEAKTTEKTAEDAEWDEPSSAEDVYARFVPVGEDGKPKPWQV